MAIPNPVEHLVMAGKVYPKYWRNVAQFDFVDATGIWEKAQREAAAMTGRGITGRVDAEERDEENTQPLSN